MDTMLSDWIFWLSSMPLDELLLLVLPVLMLDGLRYSCLALIVWFDDFLRDGWQYFRSPSNDDASHDYCPSISLIIAGLNEGESIRGTLDRLPGTYPRMQIIVVDDGSSDNMAAEARAFASKHPDVVVISKRRGGKSSALNAGLAMARGEVCVILDADSELADDALWKIVQPLRDARVGAVAGNVRVRQPSANLLTRLQAFEYLRSISLGRIVQSRLGMLGIVSGAFGAFRTSLLKELGGWDVGPGEDEDLVLRIRKSGYKIEFVPQAHCLTRTPQRWQVLTKQRRRWEWAVVTFESRKHIDMANPMNRHFRVGNFLLFAERWLFNLLLPLWCWVYLACWMWTRGIEQLCYPLILYYCLYAASDFLQYLMILYYSDHWRQDAAAIIVIPIMPFYQAYQRLITTIAIVEEMISRRSFRDGFVPEHVRQATWHW